MSDGPKVGGFRSPFRGIRKLILGIQEGRTARRDIQENVKWIWFCALARNQVKENRKREFSIAETDKYHAEDLASSDKEAEKKPRRNAHCRG